MGTLHPYPCKTRRRTVPHTTPIRDENSLPHSKSYKQNKRYFFFFFFYIIYSLLRYKKSRGALAMAKTKPKSQNELKKEKSITKLFIWGPYRSQAHTGHEINKSTAKETLLKPADSMKNSNVNLALLRRHKVPRGDYIR